MQVGLSCYVHCVVYNNKSVCDTQSCGKSLNWGYIYLFSPYVTGGVCTCALGISHCSIDCTERHLQYSAIEVVQETRMCVFST